MACGHRSSIRVQHKLTDRLLSMGVTQSHQIWSLGPSKPWLTRAFAPLVQSVRAEQQNDVIQESCWNMPDGRAAFTCQNKKLDGNDKWEERQISVGDS